MEGGMYSGTLIEQLMEAVDRVEQKARVEAADLERWYPSVPYEVNAVETNFVGVA
jgi:hypothetical protein